MNELIPYILKQLQSGGTSLVPSGSRAVTAPGTAVQRWSPFTIDGQWSEVPKGLSGPKGSVAPYVHDGNIRAPLRGGDVGGFKGMSGPTIEGDFTRVSPGAISPQGTGLSLSDIAGKLRGATGSLGQMANPLMAAIMGSIQGDVLNNHRPRMYGTPGPANPAGSVTSSPLPPATMPPSPNDQVAARFGGMAPSSMTPNDQVAFRFPDGPSPNDQVAARFGGMQPPTPQMTPNQYVAQNFPPQMAASVPMPQPRPQMAQAPTPLPQPRPAQAPQDMGFFARNTAMMRDPVTGMFIDPGAAAQAQASGGDLMQKMLGLLHNKANNV